ncbi:CBS domain-containing protein [Pseudonocardia sp. KRD-184]|uniref:CBS domain-containing protein n=1 Tax=Pseudonocardia oceani TaxID=2792013 RepID=A0ABS6UIH4_9PSEU|nr:CBS domain-containing protein [Pseudonocardia oceani]MBW0092476.1 CBS domain-containing protein [Pseudonocardia oceani]MBW0098559.1 CBS domain-containing protein [Pseudonocardia oceani]MBW0111956.1 CBS domain-containing protein [Pseudonocardia oceani]MBW0124092.1 CBS domain-containing protein [Pseudonocardia oceani]MBW0131726.1 CBS domain-containing protein [Pseudonocardia oceani]
MTARLDSAAPTDAVTEVMSVAPAEVATGDSLRVVAEELTAGEIGAVVVRARGTVVGLVSERDLVAVVASGGDVESVQAADVMSTELITVGAGTSIAATGEAMLEAGVRHVLVERDTGIVGVVSIRDVLAVLLAGAR